jgi:uncharacterized protein (DUF1697 family)
MSTYVALLRGINVGGKSAVQMGELRSLFTSLGHSDVRTYVQSGNVVFASTEAGSHIAEGLEHRIEEVFGLQVPVLLRTAEELTEVAAGNPFLGTIDDLAKLHVVFLDDRPAPSGVAGLDPDRSPPDELAVSRREVYLRLPHGAGRTKLTVDYFERALGTRATARNWRTVTKLLELARETYDTE